MPDTVAGQRSSLAVRRVRMIYPRISAIHKGLVSCSIDSLVVTLQEALAASVGIAPKSSQLNQVPDQTNKDGPVTIVG
jgi:hypothetical protein